VLLRARLIPWLSISITREGVRSKEMDLKIDFQALHAGRLFYVHFYKSIKIKNKKESMKNGWN
jgi:hypothetical protein